MSINKITELKIRKKEKPIMGMAASQARYLSLQARMSNVEYQGQQINQERTILSQQATALYNSLLDMKVPTPPSTTDFATITYTGVDGATTFELGSIKPSGEYYVVETKSSTTGGTLDKDAGVLKVYKDAKDVEKRMSTVTVNADIPYSKTGTDDFYVYDKLPSEESEGTKHQYTRSYLSKFYVPVDENGNPSTYDSANSYDPLLDHIEQFGFEKVEGTSVYVINDSSKVAQILKVDAAGEKPFEPREWSGLSIGKYETWELSSKQAENMIARYGGDYDKYVQAIQNTFGTGDNSPSISDFYVFADTSGTTTELKFARKDDTGAVSSLDAWTETYSYIANGQYTHTEIRDKCQLKFDAEGRITQIGIPKYPYNDDGTQNTDADPIGYNFIDLKASESYDKAAYEDAYNQYEYNQFLYDKKVQEINAKTEIIQAEDRSLELRLQRLDNERTQLKTEMEAVEKVINDNIDSSYKTFSG